MTDTSDKAVAAVVERLRGLETIGGIGPAAADMIEAQRAEIMHLRSALDEREQDMAMLLKQRNAAVAEITHLRQQIADDTLTREAAEDLTTAYLHGAHDARRGVTPISVGGSIASAEVALVQQIADMASDDIEDDGFVTVIPALRIRAANPLPADGGDDAF